MSEKKRSKHIVIPCSGIGKAVGTITRRAMYIVTEELLPNDTDSICLPLLTMEDEETVQKIRQNPCITVDGCDKMCAAKGVKMYGKVHPKSSIVISEIVEKGKHSIPKSKSEIESEDEKLVQETMRIINKEVDRVKEEE